MADTNYINIQGDDTKPSHDRAKCPCVLGWDRISYSVRGKAKGPAKQILQNVSGRSAPGEVTAIMGPSGSGKTTLLDILADRMSTGTIAGTVDVNGKTRKSESFRLMASYVSQDDALLGSFSVLETLRYSAQLSVAANVTADERERRVQAAIDDMGLRSCADTIVGDMFRKGLSGGQKRRLSIAIELLKHPTILLLDEPTSGLDSASTLNVMSHVLKLSQNQHCTVVCTIHQPSSAIFDLFTNIVLLANGQTVYSGSPTHALDHFASLGHPVPPFTNPSEHYLELINADFDGAARDTCAFIAHYSQSAMAGHIQEQLAYDRRSLDSTTDVVNYAKNLRPSAFRQLAVIMHRNSLNNVRNPGVYGVRLVMYAFLSVMVGTMYLYTNKSLVEDDLVNMLFYVQAFLVFMSVAVLPFFIEQRAVFARERANNALNVVSYVMANFVASLPGIFVIALVSSSIVVSLAGLHAFWSFVLNLFLSLVVAESLMHVLGATAPHYIMGIANAAGIFGMFMQMEGFMVPAKAIPSYWKWVNTIAFHSYSFEAFVHNQFTEMNTTRGNAILERFGLVDVDVGKNMLVLVMYAVVLEVAFTVVLYKWHTGRR
ncbi:hypothetical protein H310_11663 [Aphanomyces invadans]|uniref:ABC transporter domain-containing protein n=1 Tax=Aphanomyces invadans TaxID=157072 RepID=A0A024TKW3_9STRA|nr:hypothetical protein H310_11663 [Aphanomyces invadans]ETV94683.1 hypothetical protein H310_11663 [Aphanomyces invadans]|eukprot:XP_008876628.1 hypothetical protein H310_11663 [Aphanomyces invadans]